MILMQSNNGCRGIMTVKKWNVCVRISVCQPCDDRVKQRRKQNKTFSKFHHKFVHLCEKVCKRKHPFVI